MLGTQVGIADTFWRRLRGLLGRPPLQAGEGLLLRPCRAVHMHGMKYPLDVIFLDRSGAVVAIYEHLAPGAKTRWHRPAYEALELPAGTLNGAVQVGHPVRIEIRGRGAKADRSRIVQPS